MNPFAPTALAVPLGAMTARDMREAEQVRTASDRKGAVRRERFKQSTSMRQRYIDLRQTRNLSGVQIWLPEVTNQLDTPGISSLGALSPGATDTVQSTMRELDALEEQLYTELALAVSSGADVDAANEQYDYALSQLVGLETTIDAMADDDMQGWKLAAAETRAFMTEALRGLREQNKETASQGEVSALLLGLSSAAVVAVAATIIFTASSSKRRRRRRR